MRKMLIALSVTGFVLALATPTLAKVEAIKGQLIDQGCYKMNKANTSDRHSMPKGPVDNCATACAKDGHPVAVLTAEGKVYQVIGNLAANKNEKLVSHMTHTVEVTGEVTTAPDGTMQIAGTNLKMVSK